MALFSKRHYEYIERWLSTNIKSEQYRADLVTELSKLFNSDNPQFDEVRFYRECGVIPFLVETNQIMDPDL